MYKDIIAYSNILFQYGSTLILTNTYLPTTIFAFTFQYGSTLI